MNNINPIQFSPKSISSNDKWNQWFAGLTDGDGHFYINQKEKTVSYEITTHFSDFRVLYNIKNKLKAGSLKNRAGSQSVRYRIKKKEVILDIVNRLNGKLHNPIRVSQFKAVCQLFNVPYIQPPSLILQTDGYLSGLFDADGSVAISVSKSTAENSQLSGVPGKIFRLIHARAFNQMSVKITSSHKDYLEKIQKSYGFGIIQLDKAVSPRAKIKRPNNLYHLILSSEQNFEFLYQYTKIHPLKSVKMHRMRLGLLYFQYKKLKYHLQPSETFEAKIWVKFAKSWYKYSY